MFSTPPNSRRSQGRGSRAQPEDTEEKLSGGDGEVLSVLRSLQQQVSALQAQQAVNAGNSPPQASNTTPTTTPSSCRGRNKLPKELVSAVHQAVKHLRDRLEDSLEWDLQISFDSEHNAKVTSEIVTTVADENFSVTVARKAARTYFLTLKRRSKNVARGALTTSQTKQRKIQRKHNKLRQRRSACSASTSLTPQEKEKCMKILYISSEETGSESGSDCEATPRKKVSLPWRSPEANAIFESLDRKIVRRRSDKAKEMCRARRIGSPSCHPVPSSQLPVWAINN